MSESTFCGKPAIGDDREFSPCHVHSCTASQDCIMDQWSLWSACACTLNGVKRRSRRIAVYGKGEGAWCTGHTKEIAGCNGPPEPVQKPHIPCRWGLWQDWSACGVTCGVGEHTREREILSRAVNGGAVCNGPSAEVRQCMPAVCPVVAGPRPCLWSKWMQWGACDKCGGQRKRNRQILRMADDGGDPCIPGASEETERCKRKCHDPIYCAWSNWEDEGACSVTCGVGMLKRVRYLQTTAVLDALAALNDDSIRHDLDQSFGPDDTSHLRSLVLSFACGCVLPFTLIILGIVVTKSRRGTRDIQYQVASTTDDMATDSGSE